MTNKSRQRGFTEIIVIFIIIVFVLLIFHIDLVAYLSKAVHWAANFIRGLFN